MYQNILVLILVPNLHVYTVASLHNSSTHVLKRPEGTREVEVLTHGEATCCSRALAKAEPELRLVPEFEPSSKLHGQ